MTNEQDKQLLEEWKQDPSFILRHDKRFWVELPDVKNLLAAQDRLSYQRGVEAERKRVSDALKNGKIIVCDCCFSIVPAGQAIGQTCNNCI